MIVNCLLVLVVMAAESAVDGLQGEQQALQSRVDRQVRAQQLQGASELHNGSRQVRGRRSGAEDVTFLMRRNTVCVDLSRGLRDSRGRPTRNDIEDFIEFELGLGVDEVEDVCLHSLLRNVYVEVKDEHRADVVATRLKDGVFWQAMNRQIYGWRVDARYVTVQVQNVSAETSNFDISEEFVGYGEVLDCRKNRFGRFNCSDGTATLRIKLDAGVRLPNFIRRFQTRTQDAEVWRLIWKGQGLVGCYKCGGLGHGGRFCDVRANSYAAAAGGFGGRDARGSGGEEREQEQESSNRVDVMEAGGEDVSQQAGEGSQENVVEMGESESVEGGEDQQVGEGNLEEVVLPGGEGVAAGGEGGVQSLEGGSLEEVVLPGGEGVTAGGDGVPRQVDGVGDGALQGGGGGGGEGGGVVEEVVLEDLVEVAMEDAGMAELRRQVEKEAMEALGKRKASGDSSWALELEGVELNEVVDGGGMRKSVKFDLGGVEDFDLGHDGGSSVDAGVEGSGEVSLVLPVQGCEEVPALPSVLGDGELKLESSSVVPDSGSSMSLLCGQLSGGSADSLSLPSDVSWGSEPSSSCPVAAGEVSGSPVPDVSWDSGDVGLEKLCAGASGGEGGGSDVSVVESSQAEAVPRGGVKWSKARSDQKLKTFSKVLKGRGKGVKK